MHVPIIDTIRAYSQRPRLSAGLTTVLFPINAILSFLIFYHFTAVFVKDCTG